MSHTPLGEICISLGLLTPAEVARVLERMSEPEGRGMRFGEVALGLELLDDAGVSRALAQQFRLNLVPDDRVDKLQIAADVLALLPASLMRERTVVPTFLEPEKRVLSLLTHDPTDIAALRQVQAATNAARLRLFVASRSALVRLLDRLVPPVPQELHARMAPRAELREVDPDEAVTLLVEPDAATAAALRRLEALEGGDAEVVTDPEAVAGMLGPDRTVRLFFRRANARLIDPHLANWRKLCPDLRLSPVEGFGLSGRSAAPEDRARHFFLQLTEFLLLAGESKQMDARGRVRRTARLTAALAEEMQLRPEDRDAVQIAALFCDLDELSLITGMLDSRDEGRRFALAMTVLRQFDPPWDLDGLLTAVERRLLGQEGPGRDLRVEILYTARAAVRAAVVDGGDPVEALGPEAARHDARILRALAHVLRRQGLRHQVAAGGGSSSTIIVAEREAAVLTALEARLGAAGFDVLVAADGEQALELAKNLIPAAVIANLRLPRKDGITLMLELRRSDATRGIPVLLITDKGGGARDVARGLELGAEDVLEKPIHPDVVVAKLRRAVARRPNQSAGISGVLSDLGLIDLLQTLTLGGKTALVQISETGEAGGVQVREGQIVAAQHGRRTGEEALFSLASLDQGRFDVRFDDSGADNIHGQAEFLLLEALRRRDEQREAAQ
jgi:DNA-binding response OmpR family regulator